MSIRIGRQIVAGSGGSGGSGECNINVDNTTIIQNQDGTISSIASLNQNQEPIKFWTGTLAEYEQLTPDENTLYNIIDDEFEEQDKFFGFNLFDTKLSDHVIEDKGWALQGTYVNRLDYPTFYDVCLKEYKNHESVDCIKYNVLPQIQSHIFTGANGKYITLPNVAPISTANSWEFKTKYTYNGGGTYPCIIGSSDTNHFNNIHVIIFNQTTLRLYLSSNGTSWDIVEALDSTLVMERGKTYYLKIGFTGTQYYIDYSFDGVVYNNCLTHNSTTKVKSANCLMLMNEGADTSVYYNYGSMDLTQTDLTIDNNIYWKALEGVLYKNNNGHSYYLIQDKPLIDELYNKGSAWYYGIDTQNERIFLPRNNYFDQVAGDISEVGKSVEAGLPNITGCSGTLRGSDDSGNADYWGAIYRTAYPQGAQSGYTANCSCLQFDASLSNPIYGNSDTVQPNAVKKLLYICVGNTQSKYAIIDTTQITSSENDTLPLLHHIATDELLEHPSWLISNGQWYSGSVYPTVYNYLLQQYKHGTEHVDNIAGCSITYKCLKGKKVVDVNNITQVQTLYNKIGSAWYYAIDEQNMLFRLPQSNNMECYTSDPSRLGLDVEAGLPNITGSLQGVQGATAKAYEWGFAPNTDENNAINVEQTLQTYNTYGGAYSVPSGQTATFDASRSSSIYGNSNTVTPAHTKFYLYFKVANAVQNVELLNVGKLTDNINNIIPNNTSLISGQSMPSDKYIDLVFGGNGTTYTAPANGWVALYCSCNGGGAEIALRNVTKSYGTNHYTFRENYDEFEILPVARGDVFSINYGGVLTIHYFKFIYAQGEI